MEISGSAPPRSDDPHPRLLVMRSDDGRSPFDYVVDLVASSSRAASWLRRFREDADRLVEGPGSREPATAGIDADRLTLAMSREVMRRVYSLGIAHHTSQARASEDGRRSERMRYRDRAWSELVSAASLAHWHPEHWLDTATMIHAFAIAYDWWFSEWDGDQRDLLRTALVDRGLRPGLDALAAPDHWVDRPTGWNLVCNSNLLLGAVAIRDEEPELAAEVIDRANRSLANGLEIFESTPDGVPGSYRSGAMYWRSGTGYLVAAMASFESEITALSEAHLNGLRHTALYALHSTGPAATNFNYSDGTDVPTRSPALLWLARRFPTSPGPCGDALGGVATWWGAIGADHNELSWTELPTSLLWYANAREADPIAAQVPRDAWMPGPHPRLTDGKARATWHSSELFFSRSAWMDAGAVYLGAKGGFNANEHSDLDAGTFVIDALGQRWIVDHGSDNYAAEGYFDVGQHGERWSIYRKRAEGHNVLVVNPGQHRDTLGQADMLYDGHGDIKQTFLGDRQAWAVADLSSTHPDVAQWHRGWALLDDRRQIVVQDEVTCTGPSELWWFCHTASSRIDLAEDGRTAVLHGIDASMIVRLHGTTAARFTVLPACGLPTSPTPPAGTADDTDKRKLAVHLDSVTEATIVMQFTPLHVDEPDPGPTQFRALADWDTHEVPTPTGLERITVANKECPGVSPTTYSYHIGAEADLTDIVTEVSAGHTVDSQPFPWGCEVVVENVETQARGSYRIYRRSAHWQTLESPH